MWARKTWLLAVAFLAMVVLSTAAPAARADTIISISVPNPNLATQGSGPYASYDISQIGANEFQVVVTLENNFVMGDSGAFALNLSADAGAGTLTDVLSITCKDGSGLANCDLSQTRPGNEDGFGPFNFRLNDGSGFSDYLTGLTFDFTTANDVTLANLLALNKDNADAAGHFALVSNLNCTGFAANSGANKPTGTPDSTCTAPVPEPGTLMMLGSGLLALGGIFRRCLGLGG